MRVIQLRGRRLAWTLVDDEDYEAVGAVAWYLHPGGYAHRGVTVNGHNQIVYLHRWLLELGRGDKRHVDHINGDKLDNRRANLRLASPSQNSQNMVRPPGPSGHRNVYWHRSGNWRVQICVDGRRVSGGYFKDLNEAVATAAALRKQLLPFANSARESRASA